MGLATNTDYRPFLDRCLAGGNVLLRIILQYPVVLSQVYVAWSTALFDFSVVRVVVWVVSLFEVFVVFLTALLKGCIF